MMSLVEKALDATLPAADVRPVALSQAMRWAVMGGGKRVRPKICLMAAQAAGGRMEDAIQAACAIELLHSYTLVHDDLPAMDDDTERRGRPSVWAKFGEATAILAGDALQALAFAVAARAPRNAESVVASLAQAARAVVEGQVEDLNGLNALQEMFAKKTAALFAAAAAMGAFAAGALQPVADQLRRYGHELGMAFQYRDDLLDDDDGAFSSLTILGKEEVERRVASHTVAAIGALAGLPGDVEPLAAIARSLSERDN